MLFSGSGKRRAYASIHMKIRMFVIYAIFAKLLYAFVFAYAQKLLPYKPLLTLWHKIWILTGDASVRHFSWHLKSVILDKQENLSIIYHSIEVCHISQP